MKIKPLLFIVLVIFICINLKANPTRNGHIMGRILEKDNQQSLGGVNVFIAELELGNISRDDGAYILEDIPVGSYTINFQLIGYKPFSQTDVIVRSDRITYVDIELKRSLIEIEGVTARGAEYFEVNDSQPTSSVNFSHEEIRRSPGTGGDVSRIILSLPSVAKMDDQKNHLIVRGGSPLENGFYIDNIEVPNINHFPVRGTSGGALSIVNIDFVEDVDFSSGGFSSLYGDKLSSIMDIKFREGNRREFDAQLDLNFTGFGAILEGPLPMDKGSWLFSARRSYLDFLVNTIDLGTSIAPRYGDIQGKLVYNPGLNHRLTFLMIGSDDHSESNADIAEENDMIFYGAQDYINATVGINWRYLWGTKGYSNTSFSWSLSGYEEEGYETGSDDLISNSIVTDQDYKIRNVNHYLLGKDNTIEFGLDWKHTVSDYENYFAEYVDVFGDTTTALVQNNITSVDKLGGFADLILKPIPQLTASLGIRGEYYSYNENSTLSPRFSCTYDLLSYFSIKASTGIYYQTLPLILLTQQEDNKGLKNPRATHYIIGFDYLLTEDTKVSLELYRKDYRDFPLDPDQPGLFMIDELYYRTGYFFSHNELLSKGKAYSRGIELILQKKLAQNFYGLTSATLFKTEYKDLDGEWRDRVFDNRWIFSLEGGYKPNHLWEFSCRWIYAGGVPYTPFNIELSQLYNQGIMDNAAINADRYPDYHSLNLRFDRRFYFSGSNLVFYLSLWNAYNHENVAQYYWNKVKNEQDTIYQWSLLPIFGLEYEF